MNRSANVPGFLNDVIRQTFGSANAIVSSSAISGGTINQVFKLELADRQAVLLKLAREGRPGFQSEVDGLTALASTNTFGVPEVFAVGQTPAPFLIMEWIETERPTDEFWTCFGQQLAQLHRFSPVDRGQKFGFNADNVIGETPQPNTLTESWAGFFCQHRLAFQFRLASQNGFFAGDDQSRIEDFLAQVYEMLDSVGVTPSLIHGDLWSGNFLCDVNQRPVLIDPAVSYSHDEAEFSIMEMFGGFDSLFFDAYRRVHPPVVGGLDRIEVYSLYHYLNHLNIFGRSYLADCWRIIKKYS